MNETNDSKEGDGGVWSWPHWSRREWRESSLHWECWSLCGWCDHPLHEDAGNRHHDHDDVTQMYNAQDKHPDLPLFLIGHSMGGMIALRSVLRHPGFFSGMILNGPLIVPGPQVNSNKFSAVPVIYCQIGPIDFRSTPFRTFVSKAVLQLLSWVIPHVPIGRPNMNIITRLAIDKQEHRQ